MAELDLNHFAHCDRSYSNLTMTTEMIVAISGLSLLTLVVLFGNGLVICAVLSCKSLRQSVTSYLILSLAVADVSVGAFVLPFSTINSALGVWIFGEVWCRVWLMLDVFMCTASIYNLVAISIDRFIAIVRPLAYASLVTPKRGRLMILAVWVVSFLICSPPIISWINAGTANHQPVTANVSKNSSGIAEDLCQCTPLTNTPSYVIFSAMGSFYIPMALIVVMYVRIFIVARSVSHSIATGYVAMKLAKRQSLFSRAVTSFRSKPPPTVDISQNSRLIGVSLAQMSPLKRRINSGSGANSSQLDLLYNINCLPATTSIPTNSPPQSEGLRIHRGGYSKRGSDPTQQAKFHNNRHRPSDATIMVGSMLKRSNKDLMYQMATINSVPKQKVEKTEVKPKKSPVAVKNGRPPVERSAHGRNGRANFIKAQKELGSFEAALITITGDSPSLESPTRQNGRNGQKGSKLLRLVSRRSRSRSGNVNRRLTLEIRAAKTVAIVTGCFLVCWLGFAVVYLLSAFPFCEENKCVPTWLSGLVFWMGYVNSGLNVLIYAMFSKQFRGAFQRVLCLRANDNSTDGIRLTNGSM